MLNQMIPLLLFGYTVARFYDIHIAQPPSLVFYMKTNNELVHFHHSRKNRLFHNHQIYLILLYIQSLHSLYQWVLLFLLLNRDVLWSLIDLSYEPSLLFCQYALYNHFLLWHNITVSKKFSIWAALYLKLSFFSSILYCCNLLCSKSFGLLFE